MQDYYRRVITRILIGIVILAIGGWFICYVAKYWSLEVVEFSLEKDNFKLKFSPKWSIIPEEKKQRVDKSCFMVTHGGKLVPIELRISKDSILIFITEGYNPENETIIKITPQFDTVIGLPLKGRREFRFLGLTIIEFKKSLTELIENGLKKVALKVHFLFNSEVQKKVLEEKLLLLDKNGTRIHFDVKDAIDKKQFYLSAKLPYTGRESKYTIVIPKGIKNLKGNLSLEADFKEEIQILPELYYNLKVEKVESFEEVVDRFKKQARFHFNIYFNKPINPQDIAKYLSISMKDNIELNYKIETEVTPSTTLSVTTSQFLLEREKKPVIVQVKAGLRDAEGYFVLRKEHISTYYTSEFNELKVIEITSSISTPRQGEIRISFNQEIMEEEENLKKFISITPKVKFYITKDEYNKQWIVIAGEFEAGKEYSVKVLKGLQGMFGILTDDVSKKVVMEDLPPSLKFRDEGIYLARGGQNKIWVETVNLSRFRYSLYKVYFNNVLYYLWQSEDEWDYASLSYYGEYKFRELMDYVGVCVKCKEIVKLPYDEKKNKNKPIYTPIDLTPYISTTTPGFYWLKVTDIGSDNEWWEKRSEAKLIVVTDLGLIVYREGMNLYTVIVVSLSNLTPIPDVKVALISNKNQELASGVTDNRGIVKLEFSEDREDLSPQIILASKGDDHNFIFLEKGIIDLSSFPIEGKHVTGNLLGVLYSERGVYRPGDEVHLFSFIRGSEFQPVVSGLPITAEIRNPLGKMVKVLKGESGKNGLSEFKFTLLPQAKTGTYEATLFVGDTRITSTQFSVEEFLPQRLEVKLNTDKEVYQLNEPVNLSVQASYLFGTKAAELPLDLKVKYDINSFVSNSFPDYSFGLALKKEAEPTFEPLTISDLLDEKGEWRFKFTPPKLKDINGILEGNIKVTIQDIGGRTVSQYDSFSVIPVKYFIGVKRETPGFVAPGEEVKYKVVVVSAREDKILSDVQLKATIYKVNYETVLKKDASGKFGYVSVEKKVPVSSLNFVSQNYPYTIGFKLPSYGTYQVEIVSNDGVKTIASVISEGECEEETDRSKPWKVEVIPEKEMYRLGETMTLKVISPFKGKLLLSVERERVYDLYMYDMKGNSITVELPVKPEYQPNIYLVATVIRSIKDLGIDMIGRAIGIAHVKISTEEKRLDLNIEVPEIVKPNTTLPIKIKLSQMETDTAQLIVWAVDQGILQITSYKTPNPYKEFTARRALSVTHYDIMEKLIPEIPPESLPGGGEYEEEKPEEEAESLGGLQVKRVKSVVLWSGIVEVKGKEKVISFELPQFNGKLRIMAVAANSKAVGSAEKYVTVKDDIIIEPTIPRFLSFRDKFRVPVVVINTTEKHHKVTISMTTSQGIKVKGETSKEFQLKAKEKKIIYFDLETEPFFGVAWIKIEGDSGESKTSHYTELLQRPPYPPTRVVESGIVRVGDDKLLRIPEILYPFTTKGKLILSPYPAMKFASRLDYLLHYPYGCIEQKVSTLFPLIFFKDFLKGVELDLFYELFKEKEDQFLDVEDLDYIINRGIMAIESSQVEGYSHKGEGFSLWPSGDSPHPWVTVYATHFLLEAKEKGYDVNPTVLSKALDYLENEIVSKSYEWIKENYFDISLQEFLELKAYALYVLARAGVNIISHLNSITEKEWQQLPIHIKILIAGCYAAIGDNITFNKLFFRIKGIEKEKGIKRRDDLFFSSSIRDNTFTLLILNSFYKDHPARRDIFDWLSNLSLNFQLTTQETAFYLLTIGQYLTELGEKNQYRGEIIGLENGSLRFDSSHTYSYKVGEPKEIKLISNGKGNIYYTLSLEGVTKSFPTSYSEGGIKVWREYLDQNGQSLQLDQIKHGSFVIVKLIIENTSNFRVNYFVVEDWLPSGFEIENPRLEREETYDWMEGSWSPDYMDIRDDRIVLFFDYIRPSKQHVVYYAVRAVTEGEFNLPPVKAEAMYNPQIRFLGEPSKVKIIK